MFSSILRNLLLTLHAAIPRLLALCIASLPISVVLPLSAQTVGVVEKWVLQLEPGSFPVVGADGELYAVAGRRLFRIDSKTGAKKWSFYAGGERFAGITGATPTIRPNESAFVTTYSGSLYRLDARTGEVLWEVLGNGSVSDNSIPVSSANGLVYVFASDAEKFAAVDSATGEERWRFSFPRARP